MVEARFLRRLAGGHGEIFDGLIPACTPGGSAALLFEKSRALDCPRPWCLRPLNMASTAVLAGSASHRQTCSELCDMPDTGQLPGLSLGPEMCTSCVGRRTTTTILSVLPHLWHKKKWKVPVIANQPFAARLALSVRSNALSHAGTKVFEETVVRDLSWTNTLVPLRGNEFFSFLHRLQ